MRMPEIAGVSWGPLSAARRAVGRDREPHRAAGGARRALAILGGKPVRKGRFYSWPVITDNDERAWMDVLRKGRWNQLDGDYTNRFEEAWANTLGAKALRGRGQWHECGTITSLAALPRIGPGDGGNRAPLHVRRNHQRGLDASCRTPVFVDTDPETFQIDARKIEAAITERTACIMPVHLGGSAADMDTILAVAKKHKLPVVEDRHAGNPPCRVADQEGQHAQRSTASVFNRPKTSTRAKGGRFLPIATSSLSSARAFRTTAGWRRTPALPTFATGPT